MFRKILQTQIMVMGVNPRQLSTFPEALVEEICSIVHSDRHRQSKGRLFSLLEWSEMDFLECWTSWLEGGLIP